MGRLLKEDEVVGGRYRITGPFIGEGSFAEVYPAEDEATKEQVAVKIEKNQGDRVVLASELKALEGLQGLPYVCKLHGSGTHKCRDKKERQFIAMERVGDTLAELRKATESKRFSWATTCAVGVQMLDALQALHSRGYIHRDVKPANFTVGYGAENRRILMIDYGLARKYVDDAGNVHSQRSNAAFRGSSKYASIYTHQNEDQGRRDDVWSLLYLLVEFVDGVLPWTEEARVDKDLVLRLKQQHLGNPAGLTKNVTIPTELCDMSAYLQTLGYADAPDYDRMRHMLLSGIARTVVYDWEVSVSAASVDRVNALAAAAAAPALGTPWFLADQAPAVPSSGMARLAPSADVGDGPSKRARSDPASRALSTGMLRHQVDYARLSPGGQAATRQLMQLMPHEFATVFATAMHAIHSSHQRNGSEHLLSLFTGIADTACESRDRIREAARLQQAGPR